MDSGAIDVAALMMSKGGGDGEEGGVGGETGVGRGDGEDGGVGGETGVGRNGDGQGDGDADGKGRSRRKKTEAEEEEDDAMRARWLAWLADLER